MTLETDRVRVFCPHCHVQRMIDVVVTKTVTTTACHCSKLWGGCGRSYLVLCNYGPQTVIKPLVRPDLKNLIPIDSVRHKHLKS